MSPIKLLRSMFVVASLMICCLSHAQTSPRPTGEIKLSSRSVALGIGVDWGRGTLSYEGRSYSFSISGLSVLDLGIAKVTAYGEVFNLKDATDLSGKYVAGAAGLDLVAGENTILMQNDKGVVLRIHGVEKGVRFQLGGQGVVIQVR